VRGLGFSICYDKPTNHLQNTTFDSKLPETFESVDYVLFDPVRIKDPKGEGEGPPLQSTFPAIPPLVNEE
jgi:hypothetical protein